MVKAEKSEFNAIKPARTPEARQKQIMALAIDLSQKRILEGTASSAEIVYWLKQSSPQTQLELENLRMQTELLEAKIKAINDAEKDSASYLEAYNAMKGYKPTETIDGDYEEL